MDASTTCCSAGSDSDEGCQRGNDCCDRDADLPKYTLKMSAEQEDQADGHSQLQSPELGQDVQYSRQDRQGSSFIDCKKEITVELHRKMRERIDRMWIAAWLAETHGNAGTLAQEMGQPEDDIKAFLLSLFYILDGEDEAHCGEILFTEPPIEGFLLKEFG